jgi:hypothetical protein
MPDALLTGMNTTRALSALIALTFLAADGLSAQRRGSDGSGSGGRSTPSSGGSRGTPSGGGSSSGGSRSGGSTSGGSSGGTRSTPSGSTGTAATGSTRGDRDGGSAQPSADARGDGSSTSATTRREGGSKIGTIRRDADRAAARVGRGGVYVSRGIYVGGCYYSYYCGDPYWGWYGGRYGWYHSGYWYPSRRPYHRGDHDDEPVEESVGQGYDDFPYAHLDGSFIEARSSRRRGYGAISGQFFNDQGSETQAGRFGIEGAYRIFRGEIEYSHYAEQTSTSIERLHSFRVAAGVQPKLGDNAYVTATVGVRGIGLNNGGQSAGGPEIGLGLQVFPKRPIGVNLTGRAAAMTWNGQDYFALKELNATGSVFVNRLELQAGWHWLQVGSNPAFGGPVAGIRVWF